MSVWNFPKNCQPGRPQRSLILQAMELFLVANENWMISSLTAPPPSAMLELNQKISCW